MFGLSSLWKRCSALVSIGVFLACSPEVAGPGDCADCEVVRSALTDPNAVLGFESLSGWSATSGKLALSSAHTQGASSLQVTNFAYTSITSVALSSLPGITGTVRYDVQLPTTQPNPSWYGQTQLFVSCPSKNVNNAPIGTMDFTGFPLGTFKTVQFTIPDNVVAALQGTFTDLTFSIVLNVPQGTAPYLLDNLQIVTEWPNPVSKANSDPWIAANHPLIQKLRPHVLVLDFDNGSTPAAASTMAGQVAALFKEGSRPHGYSNASAQPLLEYQIDKVVDLRDNPIPTGTSKRTSSLWPVRTGSTAGFNYTTDYKQLFGTAFAARYGYADPAHAGQFLTLCQLADRGIIHDVWLYSWPDSGASGAEVLEWSPMYDAQRNKIANSWTAGAGNGVFDSDVPHCAGSLRIGFIDASQAAGQYVHSAGHGMESKFANSGAIAYVRPYFTEFAGFDLDTKYGTIDTVTLNPISSWYGLYSRNQPNAGSDVANNPCDYIKWLNPGTSTQGVAYTATAATSACVDPPDRRTINSYVPVCGNVHFPPNARRQYDQFNATAVLSTCEGYRRREGSGGQDLARSFSNANFQPYTTLPGTDPWLVWWIQSMPGFQSGILDNNGQPMPSWLPFLFY